MEKQNNSGFTLVEILIVIAIIGILALVVFIALNPIGRFQDARNSNRVQDVESIGKSAVLQFNVDNGGSWPTGIPTLNNTAGVDNNGFKISDGTPDCSFASVSSSSHPGCEWVDDPTLTSQLTPKYLGTIPTDTGNYSHYFVALTPDNNHVVVMSDSMEPGINTNPNPSSSLYYRIF